MHALITAFGGGHTGLALACLKKINGEVTFVVLENDFLTKKKLDSLDLNYQEMIEPRELGERLVSGKAKSTMKIGLRI